MAKPQFPSPHSMETIPGTEGWERMYPHYYQFAKEDSERKEYEKNAFWFNDALHYPEPLCPFDTIWDEAWFLALSQFCERVFKIPPARGVDHRIVNGNVYISPVGVADPEEIGARVPDFMERAGHYFGNWNDLEENWKKKMTAIIEELEGLEIPTLPDTEELCVVTEGRGVSKGYELLKSYDTLIDLGIRCWQYHFEFLNLGYAAYVQFVDFCTTAFPDIQLQKITQMVGGVDVIMYKPDEELKKLAKLAIELGLGDAIKVDKDVEDTLAVLAKSEKGAEWVKAWNDVKQPWFNISCGTGWYHSDGSWNDDLNIPLDAIRIYIGKLQEGKSIDRPFEQVKAESERLVSEYRALLETEEDKQTFDQLCGTSKLVFPYVENHLFYVEHWFHTVFWNKMREVSNIMVTQGLLEDVEDIWYLQKGEIKDHLWDMVTSWATNIKPYGA
ncbi:MAG: PEP-utilizing enzyme, mobile region, partial [Proteobacteria bacterium]|nr:PEP-utilizing enzyme, mobile region [Pseudomonadota bacterium]